jgi:hypothetical protein
VKCTLHCLEILENGKSELSWHATKKSANAYVTSLIGADNTRVILSVHHTVDVEIKTREDLLEVLNMKPPRAPHESEAA